jgi:ubiquinone biosynthesis protein
MAKLLTLLFEITGLFDMKTRTELVLLQKTMVVVEGVGRRLDPKLDMWSTAEPVVRRWIEDNLGLTGKLQDGARAASLLGHFAANLPRTLQRAENIVTQLESIAEDGLDLSETALKQIGEAQAKAQRLGHWALWAIALLFAIWLLR